MNYHFDWDPSKARRNLAKHKVEFRHAAAIFRDPNQLSLYDVEHSDYEDRWITLGLDERRNLLVVIHTFKQIDQENAQIRMISARKAQRDEAEQYYAQLQ